MTVKQKRMLIRILGTFGIYIALTVTEHLGLLPFGEKSPVWPALYLIPYFFHRMGHYLPGSAQYQKRTGV